MNTIKNVSWDDFDRFDEISDIYLPSFGEGPTLATQVVTVVNKLIYRWFNDGDTYDKCVGNGHLAFYANWLADHGFFCEEILEEIFKVKSEQQYCNLLYKLALHTLNDTFLEEIKDTPKEGSIYGMNEGIFSEEKYEEDDEY